MKIRFTEKFKDQLAYGIAIQKTIRNNSLYRSVKRFFYRIIRGVQWFVFSWKLFWFDSTYIEMTLAWLLEHMGKKFIKDGHLSKANERGQEMLYVAQRLRDLIDDKIENAIYDEHEKLFPNKPKLDFSKKFVKTDDGFYEYKQTEEEKNYAKTAEGKKEKKAFGTIHDRIQKATQKERDGLYTYIGKHIFDWWD